MSNTEAEKLISSDVDETCDDEIWTRGCDDVPSTRPSPSSPSATKHGTGFGLDNALCDTVAHLSGGHVGFSTETPAKGKNVHCQRCQQPTPPKRQDGSTQALTREELAYFAAVQSVHACVAEEMATDEVFCNNALKVVLMVQRSHLGKHELARLWSTPSEGATELYVSLAKPIIQRRAYLLSETAWTRADKFLRSVGVTNIVDYRRYLEHTDMMRVFEDDERQRFVDHVIARAEAKHGIHANRTKGTVRESN